MIDKLIPNRADWVVQDKVNELVDAVNALQNKEAQSRSDNIASLPCPGGAKCRGWVASCGSCIRHPYRTDMYQARQA